MQAISTLVNDLGNFDHSMHILWHALSNKDDRISKIIEFTCVDCHVRLTRVALNMDWIGEAIIYFFSNGTQSSERYSFRTCGTKTDFRILRLDIGVVLSITVAYLHVSHYRSNEHHR